MAVEDHKPPEEEPKEELVEKKQERDWRLDEDFKKFMGNPSIESTSKLERKRVEERLREIDSHDEQGNFFKGLIDSMIRCAPKQQLVNLNRAPALALSPSPRWASTTNSMLSGHSGQLDEFGIATGAEWEELEYQRQVQFVKFSSDCS